MRRRTLRSSVSVVVGLVLSVGLVTGCSSNSSTSPTSISLGNPAGTRPAGLPAWYDVPPAAAMHPGAPGTLIKSEKLGPEKGIDGTAYRVMYASETALGKPSVVTGLIYVPNTAPPATGYPVVSWAHGTNGMAPICAPSLTPDSISSDVGTYLNQLLDKGWEVVASDYQGEGTTGPLPYLVGSVSAYNTVDIVRAAGHLPAAHASTDYAVWGHSEGGQTAVFANELGPSYAPDLHLVGVVAGAPPSQFSLIYDFLTTSPYRFYLYMASVGYNAAYGNQKAPLSDVLTPLGISLEPDVEKGCYDYLQNTLDHYTLAQLTTGDPFKIPAWRTLLTENDPGQITKVSSVPLLIVQGSADEQIPPATTALVDQHLCGLGQSVQRWLYPNDSHTGVIKYYVPDMVNWLTARFAGQSIAGITPHGQAGVKASACNT